MHTIKEKRSEMSKWKACSPFPHGSTNGGSTQKKGTGVCKQFLVHVFFVPLGFIIDHYASLPQPYGGQEK
jgi:hypothetical protein